MSEKPTLLSSSSAGEPNLKAGRRETREVKQVDAMGDAFFQALDEALASYDKQGSCS